MGASSGAYELNHVCPSTGDLITLTITSSALHYLCKPCFNKNNNV